MATVYGDIGSRTAAFAAKDMLSHAEPILCLSKFGQVKPLPKNKTDTIKFRRPVPFTVSTVALTEGVTPTAQAMAYEDVTVQLLQYGAVVDITDKIEDLSEDPVLKDASMLCGEQAAETIEMLLWGKLKAGTSVFYANGAVRTAVNSAITLPRQRAVTRALKANRGKKVTSMVSASVNVSTAPVDAAYIAFGHTDLEAYIRGLAGFTPTEQYGSMQALPYEIGKVEDVRYILTPLLVPFADAGGLAATNGIVTTTGTASDVYPIIYVAKESYGLVPLKGANAITPTVLNAGTPSKSDPLGQVGHDGWKTYFEATILNQTWLSRLEVGATAL